MSLKILLSGKGNIQNYINALNACQAEAEGGYLPDISSEGYDGLILCGGGDIHPRYYGKKIDGSDEERIDTARDECEFSLIREFIRCGKPVFGICRGHQVLNVYFGGDMIQHIPTWESHKREGDAVHLAKAEDASFLSPLYGESFCINSMHHQAVNNLGKGLKVILRSASDGVIEALVHESLPVIGVQFHPERMCAEKRRRDTVDGIHIFKHFLNMCDKSR
ncbi:MAG: gamma-glutamyl-gamma-aminobutyrate hydrolase family protein [Ruminococcaceae bacterium]|nr:gamma-glutamyl-gamma-aminobutyrate hydrolase family protein [Oscillospiraceae bacterium]